MKTPESGKDTNVLRKTPEEIKKGLEEVAEKGSSAFWALETARYKTIIGDILLAGDALTYIQQLEKSYGQVAKALGCKENASANEMLNRIIQMKLERQNDVQKARETLREIDGL